MESRVSNRDAKSDEFKKSQEEFRISEAKFRTEFKTTTDSFLLQLKLLAAKLGVESSAATLTHQPCIKSTSTLSLEKSNQIVLKLQSFHKEKIRAREKVDEFLSQYRPKYKPKSIPCLRPILKKFKKVRNYDKHHDDDSTTFRSNPRFQESFGFFRSTLARKNEKVFDLLDKQVDDSMKSPPFLDSDCKIGTAKNLVSGLLISELLEKRDDLPSSRPILEIMVGFQLIVSVGTINGLQSLKNLDKETLKKIGFMGLDHCFTHEFTGSHALQVFDERSHSTDCDFQLGYHMPISDTGGTLHRFFTLNVQIKDAHSSKFLVCNGEVMKNGTIVHLKLGFHELIRDKGGTINQRLFNSKSKNTALGFDCSKVVKCEVSFDYSMIIYGECAGNLSLHHLEARMDKNRKHERKFTLSRFENGCSVVCCIVLDRDYCKGIRDKGGGSKFRYMVTLNIHFSCMNASGDSIECSQDGIFGVVLLVAYSTCIVVGGEFYSLNIELSRAGKKKSPNVREDYRVHRFYRQKKLTFESNVHGSFDLQSLPITRNTLLLIFVIVGSVGAFIGICTIVFCLWTGLCGSWLNCHDSVQTESSTDPNVGSAAARIAKVPGIVNLNTFL